MIFHRGFYREFFYRQLWNVGAALSLCGLAAFSASAGAASLNLDNVPLYIGSNVQPIVMLDITKDNQLHYKTYNDMVRNLQAVTVNPGVRHNKADT